MSTWVVSRNTIRKMLTHRVSRESSSLVPACMRTFLRQSITMPTGHRMMEISRVSMM